MRKFIRNHWSRNSDEPFVAAHILNHDIHPEGLDVERISFLEAGRFTPAPAVGHIMSIFRGKGTIDFTDGYRQSLRLDAGVHLYLPPGLESVLNAEPGTEFLHVSSPSASQARGKQILVRDETFLAACAVESQALRWVLTPQYLSRRIFLHHDQTLLSKSGNPVSWFRTTMFDVTGLPENEDGEEVFKMSYNSRTEVNVCYDVRGEARVRMAQHPYSRVGQAWSSWLPLDGDSTYHLNESARGPEEECHIDEVTGRPHFLRNKHEVHITGGYVSLFCMFDPAPTGVEKHKPGEYSDYERLSQVLGTRSYEIHRREIARYDEMADRLSMAKAMGVLPVFHGTPVWNLYLQGHAAQIAIESELRKTLVSENRGRDLVLARWMQVGNEKTRIRPQHTGDSMEIPDRRQLASGQ